MKALRLAFLAVFAAAPCAAADVTWLVYSTPYTFIEDGPKAGQGAGDRQLQYLFQHLPQYRNHVLHASLPRIWSEIGSHDGVCTPIAFRGPEREKIAVFSARPVKLTGYRLIVHSRDASRFKPYLTEAGEIDLPRLLQSADFHGGYVTGRQLPPAVVAALADKERVKTEISTMQTPLQILQAFIARRLDFSLSPPIEADFYHDTLPDEPRTAFPIKNVAREINVYSACSDAPLGRAVMRAIDRIESSDANWANFMAPFHDYFDPADFAESLISQPEHGETP